MYSFPVTCANGAWSIVPDLSISSFARSKMDISAKELLDEKAEVNKVAAL